LGKKANFSLARLEHPSQTKLLGFFALWTIRYVAGHEGGHSVFESAELGHKVDRAAYEHTVPELREALLNAQYDLAAAARFPAIIVIGGVDGAGKGETVNLLNEWMDPRHIHTCAFPEPSDEERERPRMWRFWRALPPKGKLGILFGAWHTEPIIKRVMREIKSEELNAEIEQIIHFERMLTDEGALLIKLWFHLSKERQRKRLKALEKDPRTRWRVTDTDWARFKLYDRFREVSEYYLRHTSTGEASWTVIEGEDARYRSLAVGKLLLASLREHLDHSAPAPPAVKAAVLPPPVDHRNVLGSLDLSKRLPKPKYDSQLEKWQSRLNLLSRDPKFKRLSVTIVFEGPDAAGKGGAIRRITGALDARQYHSVPVAAPTEEERAQPYLWRFWRHLPRRGSFTIYDRSWYGRVLVERVEGLCAEADWMRAYSEINDFEEQLVRNRTVVAKFWLQIDKDEQLKRFKSREQTSFKRFKITAEDWRNREKWDVYQIAADDMIQRTSTSVAPWMLVESNDKFYARIKVLKTLVQRIEAVLEGQVNL
jgi:AMP-polyphosphate phosphotransferase